jgi:LmbE family N-acetylglucosaminyl deacetylase
LPDDRNRLAQRAGDPAMIRLHRALSRLASVLTVMNTGAHPDDEQNGLLAALRFERGMRVVVACSTRGEGGQNALGPERGPVLGVLRSAEMEEAARRIDADVAWLGHGPDDPVHDFGFSKNGDDTLSRWGEARILDRLVRAYRTYRPDIVIPTFLDVPGQHGHHRAMTRAAEAAIALAADPGAAAGQGLPPWRVEKFYLPAWSGAGDAYDDEAPPPPMTLSVRARARDAVTGMTYRQLGEWSRAAHASQGMGRWTDREDRWDLHLKGGSPEQDIGEGLPVTVGDLADDLGIGDAAANLLREAHDRLTLAVEAFPDRNRIAGLLAAAGPGIAAVLDGLDIETKGRLGFRLVRKLRELDAALIETRLPFLRAVFNGSAVPGGAGVLEVRHDGDDPAKLVFSPRLPDGVTITSESAEPGFARFDLRFGRDLTPTGNFPASFDSLGHNGIAGIRVTGLIDGMQVVADLDLDEAMRILPAHSLTVDPRAAVLPAQAPVPLTLQVVGAGAQWSTPAGWRVEQAGEGRAIVRPPDKPAPGLATLTPSVDGAPAFTVRAVTYPHVRATQFIEPAALRVLTIDMALPAGARVAYAGGGSDRVGSHLRGLGLDVTDLDAASLAGDLDRFTTIVIGTLAFGVRPDLVDAAPRLRTFVENGGHLVTLYHRPGDNWHPDTVPPRRIVIGSPSVRWRVTDPDADVTILLSNHPLLNKPNRIGPEDWAGWNKERGLYFVAAHDACYEELLSLHDPEEQPLMGALVSARIGRGRHTHVALALHHQMDRLVPGAFRLMANLVQPA